MAELLIGLTQLTAGSLQARPLHAAEHEVASEPLPPPIIPGNYDKKAASCLMSVSAGSQEGPCWMQAGVGSLPSVGASEAAQECRARAGAGPQTALPCLHCPLRGALAPCTCQCVFVFGEPPPPRPAPPCCCSAALRAWWWRRRASSG